EGDDVRLQGEPARREGTRQRPARRGLRRVVRLPAAPSPARSRVHEHAALPGLRASGLPVPRDPVPGELLRPACHLSVRWAGRACAHVDGGAARPAVTGALALLRPGPGDGATAGGEPLARGADRVVELVARVPDAEAPSALPGHRVGSRDVRDAARGRLPSVAADAARAD